MGRSRQSTFFGIVLPPVPDRAPARKGWTTWQKTSPQFRLWWPVARKANWLKRNVTEYLDAAGELVAEERWGMNGDAWRMKKPAPGQEPIPTEPITRPHRGLQKRSGHGKGGRARGTRLRG